MKLLSTSLLLVLSLFTYLSPANGQTKDQTDYIAILKQTNTYDTTQRQTFPNFTYQLPSDPHLTELRKFYHLDSVAGKGNEVTRAIHLLEWMHNTVPHDDVSNLKVMNASNIIETYKATKYAQGCYGLSISMNEIFLAMGFKSRSVICYSNLPVPQGGHVINSIYIDSLKKWVWMDPQENAYVMDEKGNLLSIGEVRERLIDGRELVLNKTANYHHVPTKKEVYLYQFMAEHIYRMICPLNSAYNSQTRADGVTIKYVELLPINNVETRIDGFETSQYPTYNVITYHTNDDVLFWQKP